MIMKKSRRYIDDYKSAILGAIIIIGIGLLITVVISYFTHKPFTFRLTTILGIFIGYAGGYIIVSRKKSKQDDKQTNKDIGKE